MTDILGIGVSALLANRTALDVAGQNIANVNTDGYSRQRVDLGARSGTSAGSRFTGAGVTVQDVQRLGNPFLFSRELGVAASVGRSSVFSDAAGRIDSLLSGSDTGLGTPLSSFFSSLSALSADPASTATRSGVLSTASALSSRFQLLQGQLDSDAQSINQQLSQGVSDINADARAIADLNQQIVQSKGSGGGSSGQAPNELLDQRDQRVRALAQKLGVTTVAQDDGALDVFIANGPSLVLGSTSTALKTVPSEFDATRLEVVDGSGGVISGTVGGGSLGGLLDTRRQLLDPASGQLGRLAVTLAGAVNAQQAQGVDQNGKAGQALFASLDGAAAASSKNGGSASVAVAIGDAGQLGSGDYTLRYDGGRWNLADAATGAAVAVNGSGTAADPLVADGMKLTVSGTPVSGDRFLVQPTRGAAGRLQLTTRDPAAIAAAVPIKAAAAVDNQGSGTISSGSVADATNAALTAPATIRFIDANTYSINGSGSYAYSAGSTIAANGWSVAISGTPAAGDSFSVGPTGANSSDNRNAILLAGIASKTLLDGGLDTLTTAHARLVGQVGALSQQASLQLTAQQTLQSQITTDRNASAGVNLDEEAADLVRFQQAYQAAAQVIAIAGNVFDSLLAATRS